MKTRFEGIDFVYLISNVLSTGLLLYSIYAQNPVSKDILSYMGASGLGYFAYKRGETNDISG